MAISKLDHCSVRTADMEATRRFYEDVVGLKVGPRPNFSFPGLWLYAGDSPLVHVIGEGGERELSGETQDGAAATGNFDHIAFLASDIAGMRARLAKAQVPYRHQTIPGRAVEQIFLTDPNGVRVELNFPVAS